MKVMAIGSIVKPLTPEQRQQVMPNEVPATVIGSAGATLVR